MKSRNLLIMAGVAGIAAITFFAGTGEAKAFWGWMPNRTAARISANIERHNLMEKAFDTKDYDLWKSLVGDRPITQYINANNFSKFADMHNLAEEGKYKEVNDIRSELGLPMRPNARGTGFHCRR